MGWLMLDTLSVLVVLARGSILRSIYLFWRLVLVDRSAISIAIQYALRGREIVISASCR